MALLFFAVIGTALSRAEEDPPREIKVTPKKPVEIRSKELTFDRVTGMTEFKGKVRVTHGDTILDADQVSAASGNRQATAEDNVKVVDGGMAATLTCGHLEYRDSMKYMSAHDDPILTTVDDQNQGVTLKSRQMEFFQDEGRAVANQDVRMSHAKGNAKAGKGTFLRGEKRLILEEDPKFMNEMGTVTGRRLTAYMAENRLVAEGNVEVNFFPTPQAGVPGFDAPSSPGPGPGGPRPTPAPGYGKPSAPRPTPVPGVQASPTPGPAPTTGGPVPTPARSGFTSGWGSKK